MVISDYDVAQTMIRFGGSFVAALAQAWCRADDRNQQRIQEAFPDYWTEYRELARLRLKAAISGD